MAITIRRAKAEDANTISLMNREIEDKDISNEYWAKTDKSILKLTLPFDESKSIPFIEMLRRKIKSKTSIILVASDNSKIVGFIWVDIYKKYYSAVKKYAYIEGFFVDKDYRGSGIATKLYSNAKTFIKKKGINYIRLDISVKNPAIKLYEKLGFKTYYYNLIKHI